MTSKASPCITGDKLADELWFFTLRSILDNSFHETQFIAILQTFLNLDKKSMKDMDRLSKRRQRMKLINTVRKVTIKDSQKIEKLIQAFENQKVASTDEINILRSHTTKL